MQIKLGISHVRDNRFAEENKARSIGNLISSCSSTHEHIGSLSYHVTTMQA